MAAYTHEQIKKQKAKAKARELAEFVGVVAFSVAAIALLRWAYIIGWATLGGWW